VHKGRTHFEQIPVAVVKRVARVYVSKRERVGTDEMILQPASRKTAASSTYRRPAPEARNVVALPRSGRSRTAATLAAKRPR
jgi:hypothetical protein